MSKLSPYLLLLVFVLLHGCTDEGPDDVTKIAVVVALSGDGADWGVSELNGARMALEDFALDDVEIVFENASAADVGSAVAAFRRTISRHQPYAVIGPTWDDAGAAIAPVADELEVVTITPDGSSGIEDKNDYQYFFSTFSPEGSEMSALCRHMAMKGLRSLAVVFNQDPFSSYYKNTVTSECEQEGLRSVEYPIANAEARDFRAILRQIKASEADAIYVETTTQAAKGPFMKQYLDLDLTMGVYSSSTTDTESLLRDYGPEMEGVVFARSRVTKREAEIRAQYENRFGAPKAPSYLYAYDAMSVLLGGIVNGVARVDVRNHILENTHAAVSSAALTFDKTGRVVWPESKYEIVAILNSKPTQLQD